MSFFVSESLDGLVTEKNLISQQSGQILLNCGPGIDFLVLSFHFYRNPIMLKIEVKCDLASVEALVFKKNVPKKLIFEKQSMELINPKILKGSYSKKDNTYIVELACDI